MANKQDDSDEKKIIDDDHPDSSGSDSAELESSKEAFAEGKDVAGPLIGWSLPLGGVESNGPPETKKGLSELIEFPARYTFRVVAVASDELMVRVLEALKKAVARAVDDAKTATRPSAKGKYTSVSVELEMRNAEEVYACYAELKEVSGVRYVL